MGRPAGLGRDAGRAGRCSRLAVRPRDRWSIAWWAAPRRWPRSRPCAPPAGSCGPRWSPRPRSPRWPRPAGRPGARSPPGSPASRGSTRARARRPRVARREPARRNWLTGAGIALVLLAIFVPLFATADAAFAHMLGELVPNDAVDLPAARLATWAAVIGVGGALLWAGRAQELQPAPPARAKLGPIESLVPLTVAGRAVRRVRRAPADRAFGGNDYVLRTAGLTYAEYAREGFAQLLAVAALTLAVIAAAVRWARVSRVLPRRPVRPHARRARLGALPPRPLRGRLRLHAAAAGRPGRDPLARRRVRARAGRRRRPPRSWLPRVTVALTAATVLAFAVSNPDLRIAERNRSGDVDERLLRSLRRRRSRAAVPRHAPPPPRARRAGRPRGPEPGSRPGSRRAGPMQSLTPRVVAAIWAC